MRRHPFVCPPGAAPTSRDGSASLRIGRRLGSARFERLRRRADRVPEGTGEAGVLPGRSLALAGVDLVEDPAVIEVGLLSLAPAAEDLVDSEELHRRELRLVLLGNLLVARP